jgi:ABC-type Na+ transport system ATPase subunit NatA
MNEKEVMEGNIKLVVFDSFPYKELKKVCDAIVNLGYECELVSNGNIVFQKLEVKDGTE